MSLITSKTSGISISYTTGRAGVVSGGTTKGDIHSQYRSVTSQAGIYAGTDGYDITVKDNTTVMGSVVDSKAAPDKNSLTTGSLTMKDIENKASYEDSYRGIGYTYDRGFNVAEENTKRRGYATAEEKEALDNNYNKVGLVPDLGMRSKDSASSMTKSAIAPSKLTVTKEPVNLNTINRDTKNSLNELGKIFDKKKLEERQELAKLFAKNADEAIHHISESKGWENGSKEKIALHTLVGGITAELGGHAFIDGGLAGGVNEAAVAKLMNAIGKDNPDMVQIASAVLGYAMNKLAGKDGQAGAAVAQWGTKWNASGKAPTYERAYILRNDGFAFQIINGVPTYIGGKYAIPEGAPFWAESIDEPGWGHDYLRGNDNDVPDSYIEREIKGSYYSVIGGKAIGFFVTWETDAYQRKIIKEDLQYFSEAKILASMSNYRVNSTLALIELLKKPSEENRQALIKSMIMDRVTNAWVQLGDNIYEVYLWGIKQ